MRRSSAGFLVSLLLATGLVAAPSGVDAVTQPGNERIASTTDPVLASVQLSQHFIKNRGDVEAVVLGRSDQFPDNLGGSALTGASKGVMLLTDGGSSASLRTEVRDEIKRVLTPRAAGAACTETTANVYILGGTAAVSASVENTLESDGWCVIRRGGSNRFGTAELIADTVRALTNNFDFSMIARSDNPVDSASAGAWASKNGIPIVLSTTASLPSSTSDYLFTGSSATKFDVFMLGGEAALSSDVKDALEAGGKTNNVVPQRIAGSARDTTAVEIAKQYKVLNSASGTSVVIVNGYRDDTWVYALTAGALAYREDIVVLYVREDRVDAPTCDYIGTLKPPAIKVLGSTSVVSNAAYNAAIACVGFDGSNITLSDTSYEIETRGNIPGKATDSGTSSSFNKVRFSVANGVVTGIPGDDGNPSNGKTSNVDPGSTFDSNTIKVTIAGGFSNPASPTSIGSRWDFKVMEYANGVIMGEYARTDGTTDTGTFQMCANSCTTDLPAPQATVVPATNGPSNCSVSSTSSTRYTVQFTGTTPGVAPPSNPPNNRFDVRFSTSASGAISGSDFNDNNNYTRPSGNVVCNNRTVTVLRNNGSPATATNADGTWTLYNIVASGSGFTGDYTSTVSTGAGVPDVGTFTMVVT